MQEFNIMSVLYDLFKSTLWEAAAGKSVSALLEADGFQRKVLTEAAAFRSGYFGKFNAAVKKGFERFQTAVQDQLVKVVGKQNPYHNWQGDKLIPFPLNCRFWWRGQSSLIVVMEEGPQYRTLLFDESFFGKDTFRLALPNIVFFLVFHYVGKNAQGGDIWSMPKMYAGCTKKPLQTSQDMICELPMPDLRYLEVCLGRRWQNPIGTVTEQCHSIISYFWQSTFRHEWTENITRYHGVKPSYLWPPDNWEKKTLEEVIALDFYPRTTLQQHIVQIAADLPALFSDEGHQVAVASAVANAWDQVQDTIHPAADLFETCFETTARAAVMRLMADAAKRALTAMEAKFIELKRQQERELKEYQARMASAEKAKEAEKAKAQPGFPAPLCGPVPPRPTLPQILKNVLDKEVAAVGPQNPTEPAALPPGYEYYRHTPFDYKHAPVAVHDLEEDEGQPDLFRNRDEWDEENNW